MSTNVLEIDAIGVDEWEHEQHTPRAMDENLAALVKQSSAQSGPVRAPALDDAWEAETVAAPAEPAKQRTTTNTVARPAPPNPTPKPKTKTMALPTVAALKPAAPKPAAPKPSAVPQPIARAETKAIVSPAAKEIARKPDTGEEAAPGFVEVKPRAARGAATPPSAKPVAKPAAKPTPPPQPIAVVAAEPSPPRAPTPLPFSPMTLPAWPPSGEFEDWDNPHTAATTVDNKVSPRPVAPDFKDEDSVVVNLDAKPTVDDKPRRPQTAPVVHTSEQNPSTSGAFVMPTAAQPNATPIGPERASSPGWNTPLPQPLPGEPFAAPAAPVVAKHAVVASLLPLVRRRGVVIAVAGAAVVAIVVAIGSHGSPQPTTVARAASKTTPTVSADSTQAHVTPTRADATPAPPAVAAVKAVASPPTPKVPAKKPVALRRISRNKKPVVVDYDTKSTSSPLDVDQALAQARAAYAIGNQHLFAGESREAVTAYRNALSIYPSYAAGYRGLGLAFAQLDDKPAALAAFKNYVKLAPAAKDIALIQKRIRNLSVR